MASSAWSPTKVGTVWVLQRSEWTGSGLAVRGTAMQFNTQAQADVAAARLNGTPPPRLISAADCAAATRSGIHKVGLIRAIHDIMVKGHTWAVASAAHGVSQPGINNALHRVGLR